MADNNSEFGKRLAKIMKKMKAEAEANRVPPEEQQGVINPNPDAEPQLAKPKQPDSFQDPTEYTTEELIQREQRIKKGLRHKRNKDGSWTTTRGGKPVK